MVGRALDTSRADVGAKTRFGRSRKAENRATVRSNDPGRLPGRPKASAPKRGNAASRLARQNRCQRPHRPRRGLSAPTKTPMNLIWPGSGLAPAAAPGPAHPDYTTLPKCRFLGTGLGNVAFGEPTPLCTEPRTADATACSAMPARRRKLCCRRRQRQSHSRLMLPPNSTLAEPVVDRPK
jgi:hypothetical protein